MPSMFRGGRWFWWVVATCVIVLVADLTAVGPFADPDRDQQVEVLDEVVERSPATTTTSTVPVTTSTTLSEAEALEELEGLDPETLRQLDGLKTLDPEAREGLKELRGYGPEDFEDEPAGDDEG